MTVSVISSAVTSAALSVCSKLHKYTPSAASKDYSKPVSRKSGGVRFNPHDVVDLVRLGTAPSCKTQSEKSKIVTAYIEVAVACILLITLLYLVSRRFAPSCRIIFCSSCLRMFLCSQAVQFCTDDNHTIPVLCSWECSNRFAVSK